MSALGSLAGSITRSFNLSKPGLFFATSSKPGRRIICSFSYLQRIRKRGQAEVWFPSETHQRIVERLQQKDPTVLGELGVEWAAIREFALIQESEYEEDFKPERLLKAIKDSTKWRGQTGYRMTVVILGNYERGARRDELQIHDEQMQKEITNLIHLLYLEEESRARSESCHRAAESPHWSCAKALPHMVMHMKSVDMTGRGMDSRRAGIVNNILDIVEKLPRDQVQHDFAVGLALPDLLNKHHNDKIKDSEEKFHSFQRLMSNFFGSMGWSRLGDMHGNGLGSTMATPSHGVGQMAGFGNLRAADNLLNLQIAEKLAL